MVFGIGKKNDSSSDDNSTLDNELVGKYNEQCSVCGKSPTDKKWGGQYFHKKCLRKIKKMSKGML
ncbi:MAG: hypothetical protein PHX27_01860 [Candidatus ainarchaeum sp.]|nr:hypothetical protein [Candidatus ainarchaeum sp.]